MRLDWEWDKDTKYIQKTMVESIVEMHIITYYGAQNSSANHKMTE